MYHETWERQFKDTINSLEEQVLRLTDKNQGVDEVSKHVRHGVSTLSDVAVTAAPKRLKLLVFVVVFVFVAVFVFCGGVRFLWWCSFFVMLFKVKTFGYSYELVTRMS